LERDSEELASIKLQLQELLKQMESIKAEKEELLRRISDLQHTIELKEEEINELKQKYIEDMAAIKQEHATKIAEMTASHTAETESIKAEYADKLTATIDEYESKVAELTAQLEEARTQYQTAVADCEKKLADMKFAMTDYDNEKQRLLDELDQKLKETEARCEENIKAEQKRSETEKITLNKRIDELKEQAALLRGELDGIRIQQGKMTPSTEYSSRERFTELEDEYEAFQKFFKRQWEFTKKEIRKTILWTKDDKKKK
ncbi:MAG: hypothetical protein K2O67_04810, partial [Clostridia bacterium]|nr:hypothetical protein [Clostridia bacterium]